jgi:RimJ/RimL family protein N-acetyltransferase
MAARYRPMAFAIETERLVLRLRGPADAAWNLELLGEHEPPPPRRSLADEQARLAAQHIRAQERGLGFLAIQRRAEGDRIGYCGLLVGRASFDEPEIAYELLRRVHGHGYATEAARAVLDAAFATGRRRVWATVRAWNAPSFRVLDKLGFRRDHTLTDERGEVVYLYRDSPRDVRVGGESTASRCA